MLEPVERADRRVKVRCVAAGHELEVWPSDPRGCRVCTADSLRLPQAIWDERIARVGGEWLDEVRGSGTPTRAR